MTHPAAELDRPDSIWNRAAQRSAQGDPFCCRTEWQLSLQESYFPKRTLHLRESGSSLLALAERDHPDLGPTLEPLDSLWYFGSPLLGPDAADLLEAFLAERVSHGEPATFLLSGIIPGDALRERILRSFLPRFEIYRIKTVTVCSASLAGGLDGFLARRSRLLRRRLRQATRRARDAGVEFERIAPRSASEAEAAFARMLEVERTSWKGIARRGMGDRYSTLFYSGMVRRLAVSGSARVIFARAGERDIGFIFGGLAGTVYRGQQFSYADDWAPFSIGNLMQQEQIAWLAEDAILKYDMGPLMDYKDHWTETRIDMEVLLLRPRRGPGSAGTRRSPTRRATEDQGE